MEVIARKRYSVMAFALLLAGTSPLWADRASDVRAQLASVSSALASGDATEALRPFDKAMPQYDKLSLYFAALTASYDVTSEIEVIDEEDGEKDSRLKVDWTLQLSDRGNGANLRHTYPVTLRLRLLDGKWRITDFTPVEMFDPQGPGPGRK